MRRVDEASQLADALAAAAHEAGAAFSDSRVYVERVIEQARHVEVQVLADQHGNVAHVFERECSLQRRFQKVIEEAPAPNLSSTVSDGLLDAAVRATRAVGYEGAGSVEFLVADDRVLLPGDEHALAGRASRDRARLRRRSRAAADQDRGRRGTAVPAGGSRVRGHAIEARICAEDPSRAFAPSPGRIASFAEPGGPGIRCDAGVASGSVVPPEYDALIAKVIAWAPDRAAALQRLRRALARAGRPRRDHERRVPGGAPERSPRARRGSRHPAHHPELLRMGPVDGRDLGGCARVDRGGPRGRSAGGCVASWPERRRATGRAEKHAVGYPARVAKRRQQVDERPPPRPRRPSRSRSTCGEATGRGPSTTAPEAARYRFWRATAHGSSSRSRAGSTARTRASARATCGS